MSILSKIRNGFRASKTAEDTENVHDSDIVLGASYKCILTGFVGVAVAHTAYITGCNRTYLQPRVKEDDDGTFRAGDWFDDHCLERQNASPSKTLLGEDNVVKLPETANPGFGPAAPRM